jgi:hypothetical protein
VNGLIYVKTLKHSTFDVQTVTVYDVNGNLVGSIDTGEHGTLAGPTVFDDAGTGYVTVVDLEGQGATKVYAVNETGATLIGYFYGSPAVGVGNTPAVAKSADGHLYVTTVAYDQAGEPSTAVHILDTASSMVL